MSDSVEIANGNGRVLAVYPPSEQGQEQEGQLNPVSDQSTETREQSHEETREQIREKHKPDYPPRVPNTRNFRRIQKLLFAYPGTAIAIKNLEMQLRQIDNELIRSGVANYNIGSGGSISSNDIEVLSGPENDASRRIDQKQKLKDKINTLRARQEAIRAAVNQLGDREGRIIRTKYFLNWESKNPGARIWRELEMKWDTYLKRLTWALEFIGRWIGEWNDKPVEKVEEKGEGQRQEENKTREAGAGE